jgi:hypothetical protein
MLIVAFAFPEQGTSIFENMERSTGIPDNIAEKFNHFALIFQTSNKARCVGM